MYQTSDFRAGEKLSHNVDVWGNDIGILTKQKTIHNFKEMGTADVYSANGPVIVALPVAVDSPTVLAMK